MADSTAASDHGGDVGVSVQHSTRKSPCITSTGQLDYQMRNVAEEQSDAQRVSVAEGVNQDQRRCARRYFRAEQMMALDEKFKVAHACIAALRTRQARSWHIRVTGAPQH